MFRIKFIPIIFILFISLKSLSQPNKYQNLYRENCYFYSYINQNQTESFFLKNNRINNLKTNNYPKINYGFDYKWLSITLSTPVKMFSNYETVELSIGYGVNINKIRINGKYERNNYTNKSSSTKYELEVNYIKSNSIVNYSSCFFFTRQQKISVHSPIVRIRYFKDIFNSKELDNTIFTDLRPSLGYLGCINLKKGFFFSYEALINTPNTSKAKFGYHLKSMLGYTNKSAYLGFYIKNEKEDNGILKSKNKYWMFIWGVRF